MLKLNMKRSKKNILLLVFSIIILALLFATLTTCKEQQEMISDRNIDMEMFSTGRYVISLPASAKMVEANLVVSGVPIKIKPDYLKARAIRAAEKEWTSIYKKNGSNKIQSAEREILPNNAQLLKYNHIRIKGEGLDGSAIDTIVFSTLAYIWWDNTLFTLGGDGSLNKENEIKALINKLEAESNDQDESSLCYVTGCISQKTGDESLDINFEISDIANLKAKFQSDQYSGEANSALSERKLSSTLIDLGDEADWIMKSDYQHHTYRNAKRISHDLSGEEIIEASVQKSEGNYLIEVNAKWYYPGIPGVAEKPEITIQLDYSYTVDKKPSSPAGFLDNTAGSDITEADFMHIWDTALDSFSSR